MRSPSLAGALALVFAACGGGGGAAPGQVGGGGVDSVPDAAPQPTDGVADAEPAGPDDVSAEDGSAAIGDATVGPVDATAVPDAITDVGVEPPPGCGTGSYLLPAGLETIAWDDGTPEGWLADYNIAFDYNGFPVDFSLQPVHEAVRFAIEHPSRVHGFSVHWSNLPAGAPDETELTAALYPDFGHNGRDFFHEGPLWEGTRCLGDVTAGAWIDYTFGQPIDVQPGLLFVGHRREDLGQPALSIDATDAPPEWWIIDPFEGHTTINLPAVGDYEHELTLDSHLDFMVRLHLEPLEQITPEERLFQPLDVATGSRASWGDYDRDGWDDLLSNGTLLHNDAGAGFSDVTEAAGLVGKPISGGVWGDYDNDGCLDLFTFAESTTAGDALWHAHCDGTFEDVTEAMGIDDVQDYNLCEEAPEQNHAPSPAAAWWDIDGDGLLDLVVVGFICWPEYSFYRDQFFLNVGDGFVDITAGSYGLLNYAFSGRGASPIDHDLDGDVDLLINNYTLHRNVFYDNQGDGTVLERAEPLGLAGELTKVGFSQAYGHTIGAAWGDLDGDGDFDNVQGNLAHPRFFWFSNKTQVLLDDGTGHYADNSGDWSSPVAANGIRYQETHSVPLLADFDHDGHLDLAISAIYPHRPTDFYWGLGDGTFELDSYHAGLTRTDGWGLAAADFDHDGDLDLAYHGLWENAAAAVGGHWLQVGAIGNVKSNRAALGATVWVTAGERTWLRHVQGGTGQGCQDSATLHFGLGEAATVDRIEVAYPGGEKVVYEGPWDADQRLWVAEDGAVTAGWAPPIPEG